MYRCFFFFFLALFHCGFAYWNFDQGAYDRTQAVYTLCLQREGHTDIQRHLSKSRTRNILCQLVSADECASQYVQKHNNDNRKYRNTVFALPSKSRTNRATNKRFQCHAYRLFHHGPCFGQHNAYVRQWRYSWGQAGRMQSRPFALLQA